MDDLNFTFEVFPEYAQQTITYAGKIVDDVIKLELVGFDIEIELEQVKEEE